MYEKTVLPNGLRILTGHMPHTRSVSVSVYAGVGSRYEDDEEAGISHFVEHMLFKGTHRRPSSVDISGAIEQVGGVMNGGTDRELTSFWCKVAQPHFGHAVDVLIDMVRNPILDPAEVDKERSVVQEELSMTNDYPSYRVDLITDELLWPNQPMGRDIGGSRESVQGISHQMLADWFNGHYGADNVVISVAGSISHDQVVKTVAPLAEGWERRDRPTWSPATYGTNTTPQVRMENRKTEQAHMALSLPGLDNRHPDRYALDMMNTVLGDGMSSRLFIEVREKRGLAYDIHSSVSHFRDTGSISVGFGVDPTKARQAVETVLGELRKIKSGVGEDELTRAKEFAKGRLLLRMEDTRAVSGWAGAQEALYDEVLAVDEVVEKVDAVTIADVERMANQFLLGDRMNLVVVGPYRSDKQFQAVLKG